MAREQRQTSGGGVTRRRFLGAAGAGAAAIGLAACGSSTHARGRGPTRITFTTWASDAESKAFTQLIARFHESHPTIRVDLDLVPYTQDLQDINSRLQAGNPPDAFRITYTNIGIYSSKKALLDLTPYVDRSFREQFLPGYYAAIEYDGKPYGIPHQTDTTALVYDKALLARAGVRSVPDSLRSAWSWDEFLAVARKVQQVQGSAKFAFAYDWQLTGAFRWLSWLYQAGGNLLTPDRRSAAIDDAAGRKAIAFTKGFFDDRLVPPNTSTGNETYPDTVFLSKTVGMAFAADFLLPDDIATAKFDWGVTFQPRDVAAASDLGGNGIVGAADTHAPEATATFMRYLAGREAMSSFCALTNELPTRRDLSATDIKWALAADKMPVFVEQATTVTPAQAREVTIPAFGLINTALQNDLDACFVNGKSPSDTASSIAGAIDEAIKMV